MALLAWSWLSFIPNNLHILPEYDIPSPRVVVSYYQSGHVTANGEVFDPDGLTTASPKLPFGTLLTIKGEHGIANVRVNDRGPFRTDALGKAIWPLEPHPVRRLDLSRGAFRKVCGDVSQGLAEVTILRIKLPNSRIQDTKRIK